MREKRILIVDDEEELRRLFSRIMEREGYLVDVAGDGREAVWKATYNRYSVIIMDLRMPKMTGQEAIIRIERLQPNVKFMVISGYPLDLELRERVEHGEITYFSKPFDNMKVMSKVAELCNEKQL